MEIIIEWFKQYWLNAVLVVGAVIACYWVYQDLKKQKA